MTSLDRVRDTLLATARTGPLLAARDRQPKGPDGACRFLATHVDRTVLARRILMDFTDGTSLTIEARHRRVLRISQSANSSQRGDGKNTLSGRPLRSDDSATLAHDLRAHLAGRTIRRLQALDDPAIDFPDTPGVALTSLMVEGPVADIRPHPEELVSALTGFVDRTSADIVAACMVEGADTTAICGPADIVTAMAVWANKALDLGHAKRAGSSPALGTEYVGSLAWSDPPNRHLLIHRTARSAGLVLIEGSETLAFLSKWKACMQR